MTPTAGVRVELGGEVRTLRYTNAALVRLEDETGKTVMEMGERLTAGSLKAITCLVWAGMLHAEPSLTLDEAAERVDLQRLEEIATAAGEAIEAALGPASKNGDGSAEGNVETAQD